jgi:hypothetical protein
MARKKGSKDHTLEQNYHSALKFSLDIQLISVYNSSRYTNIQLYNYTKIQFSVFRQAKIFVSNTPEVRTF